MNVVRSKPILGVLGGSFDPVHFGHLLLSWEALISKACDKVILTPCGDERGDKKLSACGRDRLQMTKLGLDYFMKTTLGLPTQTTLIQVDNTEIEHGTYIPTYSLLKKLEVKYPDNELWFIIGSDLIGDIKNWHNGEVLVNEARFLIVPRPQGSYTEVETACNRYGLTTWKDLNFESKGSNSNMLTTNCSSTEARLRLQRPDYSSACRVLLPLPVLNFISDNHLYGVS